MTTLPVALHHVRRAGLWLVPFALVAGVLWWQAFGRAVAGTPDEVTASAVPPSMSLALLPEYQPGAVAPVGSDAVERTLFNPTRRPAPSPVAAPESAKPKIQRGQFALSGTMIVDGKVTAFLREVSGGKSRRVRQGETLNGMVVAEIKADRVRLAVGDESEELLLKVAAGPKTTIQPVTPAANRGPVTATAVPAPPPGAPGTAAPRDVSEVLAERRRLARAQELAAQGVPPGAPVQQPGANAPVQAPTMPPTPQGDFGTNDPRWQQLYQRYQQPRR